MNELNEVTVAALTPLMQQYRAIKASYCDTLLFFQVGDFYELFFDDAKKAAAFLGIVLTKRGKVAGADIPLCGIPVHALDHYLVKLIKGGFKIAICDQLEEARPGTVVKRGVTRMFTAGTLTQENLLDAKSASYLCTLLPSPHGWILVFGELLTAQLLTTTIQHHDISAVEHELGKFIPDEIVVPASVIDSCGPHLRRVGYTVSVSHDVADDAHQQLFHAWIQAQFDQSVVERLRELPDVSTALFYFYAYVRRTQESALSVFKSMQWYRAEDFVQLDHATQINLELTHNLHDKTRQATLLWALDEAVTPMGSRLIKKWLLRPLSKKEAIEQRLDILEYLTTHHAEHRQIKDLLGRCGDLERVIGRILLHKAPFSDFLFLKDALLFITPLKQLIHALIHLPLGMIIDAHIDECKELGALLSAALVDEASMSYMIRPGYNAVLDELRNNAQNQDRDLAALEHAEQKATGIDALKIGYNAIYGYYFEVTKTHAHKVPSYFRRIQSLVGKERYVTDQVELLQKSIERAKKESETMQEELFVELKKMILAQSTLLRRLAHGLAHLDALSGLAQVAYQQGYVRPSISEERGVCITQGRHPVVERLNMLAFVANDVHLDDRESLWIITGPNMGGKSTFMRQVALIVIMAHIGSFVPAHSATIGLVDRIFTRIGAGDNVAGGKSTFLVEMEETAAICQLSTYKSLVILDEVGRGTSTKDGQAIAQAVIEFIARAQGPLCLFATHYHELTALQERYAHVVAYHAASISTAHGVILLYTIKKGVADGSFGIEVAKMARLPEDIILRAYHLMHEYTGYEIKPVPVQDPAHPAHSLYQSVLNQIRNVDVDGLSPRQTFDLVAAWQKELIKLDQSLK